MPAQGVSFTILDNGLGLAPGGTGNTLAVVGVSSIGTSFQPFQSPQPQPFVTQFGYGPGPELAAKIANDTGNNVIFVKAPSVSAGTNTAVTATRVGTPSTSAVTLSGTPLDTYYGLATVMVGGTIGTTGIQIGLSLDAGRTTYATVNLLTATSYVIPNTGLTLNFGAGTLNAGDTFAWVSTEPKWNDAGVVSAMQSLLTITTQPVDIAIAGDVANVDATAFDAEMTTLFNAKRFCRLLTNARDAVWGGTSTETEVAWMTSIQADYAAFVSVNGRTHVGAGHYNFISPISQTQFRRPLLWGAASRDSAVAIQVDLGRVLDGNIPLFLPALPDGYIYHDESVNSGLDAARFMSMWSLAGLPGLYIKNPNSMATPGSDFKWLQYGHVVDAACVIAYLFFVKQLSNSVRVDSTTGFILPQDKSKLENGCNQRLLNGLTNAGAVSSAVATINGATNILSTQQLLVTVTIVPLAYLKSISVTITFLNPALVQVSTSIGATP
jgi:uncharacterized protein DUF2586